MQTTNTFPVRDRGAWVTAKFDDLATVFDRYKKKGIGGGGGGGVGGFHFCVSCLEVKHGIDWSGTE